MEKDLKNREINHRAPIPESEAPDPKPSPVDDKNESQARMQGSYDAQAREANRRDGNQKDVGPDR